MVGSVEAPDSARDTSAEKEWAALELDSLAIRKRTRTRLVLIGASVLAAVVIVMIILAFTLGGGGDEAPADEGSKPGTSTSVFEVDVRGLGTAIGMRDNNTSLEYFLGVPFAQPPVDDLRWQPPLPLATFQGGIANATSLGSCCVQPGGQEGSEDCLYLNIMRPAGTAAGSKLPVLFWIHGGGYYLGCSDWYTESTLTAASPIVHAREGGVILITINYRLGIFGFLGGDAIAQRTFDGSSGNFGIQDQQAALKWVAENIDSFGGDPDRVTIFGESAGGNAVLEHLVRPASFPYYRGAVMQSGGYVASKSREAAAMAFNYAVERANATAGNELDTLLRLNTTTVATLPMDYRDGHIVVVDGVASTAPAHELIARGEFNRAVPIIITSTRDEMALWVGRWAHEDNPEHRLDSEETLDDCLLTFDSCMGAWDGLHSTLSMSQLQQVKDIYAMYDQYPYPDKLGIFSQWWWMFMRFSTDFVPGFGRCGSRYLVDLLVEGGAQSVYEGHFVHPLQDFKSSSFCFPIFGDCSLYDGILSPHAFDIVYTFGFPSTDDEVRLARAVEGYWTSFAATGDPNTAGLPSWPARSLGGPDALMSFGGDAEGGLRAATDVRKEACDWQEGLASSLGYQLPNRA